MNHRPFNFRLISSISMLLVWLITMPSCQSDTTYHTFHKGPYLQNPTLDGMTIMWESKELASGEVRYGTTEKLGKSSAEFQKATIHSVILNDLEPATKYFYQVVTAGLKSEIHSFYTAVEEDDPFSFVTYGDNKNGPFNHEKVANLALSKDPNFALHNGDLVNRGGVYIQWEKLFFNPISHLISHVPLYTVMGNHEDNSDHYFNYFCPPCDTLAYYSFDYGNAHIIALNSESEAMLDSPEQFEWLVRDLEDNQSAEWKFVVFHVPPFTSGGNLYSKRRILIKELLAPVFQKYKVDMVFSGHDHHYERTYPIGFKTDSHAVTYVVCGNGGTPLRFVWPREWSLYAERVFGFTNIHIDGSKLTMRAININDEVIDELTLDKSDPASVAAYKENMIYYEDIEDANVEAIEAFSMAEDMDDEERFEEAIEWSRKTYQIDPGCYEALGLWAECLMELERYDEALEKAKELSEKVPVFPDSYEVLVECNLEKGNYEEAQKWADQLHEISSDSPDAMEIKAEIYEEQDEMELAIQYMIKALEILPNDSDLHFGLAGLYEETGDTASALKYYTSGMEWYMDAVQDEAYLEAQAYVNAH